MSSVCIIFFSKFCLVDIITRIGSCNKIRDEKYIYQLQNTVNLSGIIGSKGDARMKALAMLLTMIIFCIAPVAASPAAPIFSGSIGMDGVHANYFPSDFLVTNWMFQGSQTNYPAASFIASTGSRFNLGYASLSRNEAFGYDNKIITAGIYKKMAENWGLTVGYESGQSRFFGLNFGAFYSISPNAAISIISTLNTNYSNVKNSAITTHLIVRF